MHVLEVSDGDDDGQVERRGEQRDGRQQNIGQHDLVLRPHRLPARGVEELWKAKVAALLGLHRWGRSRLMVQRMCISLCVHTRNPHGSLNLPSVNSKQHLH